MRSSTSSGRLTTCSPPTRRKASTASGPSEFGTEIPYGIFHVPGVWATKRSAAAWIVGLKPTAAIVRTSEPVSAARRIEGCFRAFSGVVPPTSVIELRPKSAATVADIAAWGERTELADTIVVAPASTALSTRW